MLFKRQLKMQTAKQCAKGSLVCVNGRKPEELGVYVYVCLHGYAIYMLTNGICLSPACIPWWSLEQSVSLPVGPLPGWSGLESNLARGATSPSSYLVEFYWSTPMLIGSRISVAGFHAMESRAKYLWQQRTKTALTSRSKYLLSGSSQHICLFCYKNSVARTQFFFLLSFSSLLVTKRDQIKREKKEKKLVMKSFSFISSNSFRVMMK